MAAFETTFIEQLRFSNVADVDHVALLEHIAPIADGHQLHLAIAHAAGHEVGEELHVVRVHPAIQIRDAVRSGVAMVVRPNCQGRAGQRQASTRGGAQKLTPRGMEDSFP